MTFEQTEEKVIQWLKDRKIHPNSNANVQTLKAVSEMGELADAIAKIEIHKAMDAIGDITVCLVSVCQFLGVDFAGCFEMAYDTIKDRKGTLLPNGIFVKEEQE